MVSCCLCYGFCSRVQMGTRYSLETSDDPLGQVEGLTSGPGSTKFIPPPRKKTLHFGTSLVVSRELCLF